MELLIGILIGAAIAAVISVILLLFAVDKAYHLGVKDVLAGKIVCPFCHHELEYLQCIAAVFSTTKEQNNLLGD